MNIKGVDVSGWQGNIDYGKLARAKQFVIMKATEGNGFTDPKFNINQTNARKTDICIGYYHFARPDLGNTGSAEAGWMLKILGNLKNGEVIALDVEGKALNYKGDLVGWVLNFMKHIYSKTKIRPLLYINGSTASHYDWSRVIKNNNGLWLADWDYSETDPPIKTKWAFTAIKQYSNQGVVSGVAGRVDLDIFYGDKNTFKKYGYKENVTPPTPSCEDKLKKCNQDKITLLKQLKKAKDDLKECDRLSLEKTQEIDRLRDEIKDLVSKCDAKVKKLGQKITSLENENVELTQSNEGLKNEVEVLKKVNKTQADKIERQAKEITRLKKALEKCRDNDGCDLGSLIKKIIDFILSIFKKWKKKSK